MQLAPSDIKAIPAMTPHPILKVERVIQSRHQVSVPIHRRRSPTPPQPVTLIANNLFRISLPHTTRGPAFSSSQSEPARLDPHAHPQSRHGAPPLVSSQHDTSSGMQPSFCCPASQPPHTLGPHDVSPTRHLWLSRRVAALLLGLKIHPGVSTSYLLCSLSLVGSLSAPHETVKLGTLWHHSPYMVCEENTRNFLHVSPVYHNLARKRTLMCGTWKDQTDAGDGAHDRSIRKETFESLHTVHKQAKGHEEQVRQCPLGCINAENRA